MSKRGNPYPNRYKNGKIVEPISFEQFKKIYGRAEQLERAREKRKRSLESEGVVSSYRMKLVNIRALIVVLYYLGLRISEIVGDIPRKYETRKGAKWSRRIKGLTKEDLYFEEDSDLIGISAFEVRKHGHRDNPLYLKKTWLGVDQVIEVWNNTEPGERLFPIDKSFAWRLVKGASNRYPHFFRLNRATEYARHWQTSIKDLQEWFGWVDPRTIRSYMGQAGRTTKPMVDRVRGQ